MELVMPNTEWLLNEFGNLRQQLTDQHQRLRSDMTAGFDRLRGELNQHTVDDRIVAEKVIKIEAAREIEAEQVIRHGAWAGIFTAAGLTAAIEAIRFLVTGHLR